MPNCLGLRRVFSMNGELHYKESFDVYQIFGRDRNNHKFLSLIYTTVKQVLQVGEQFIPERALQRRI